MKEQVDAVHVKHFRRQDFWTKINKIVKAALNRRIMIEEKKVSNLLSILLFIPQATKKKFVHHWRKQNGEQENSVRMKFHNFLVTFALQICTHLFSTGI